MTSKISILPCNPKANYLAHKTEIDSVITRVLDSGRYCLGREVAAFEKEFASFIGVDYAVGVGSGTEALHLALRACGIGIGDEVLTVSHTAVATVAAIEICGATPVMVDIDPRTYTLDPDRLQAAITPRTRAILPVHLYGHPADLSPIIDIARRHELKVIEDCAQAHGAIYRGRRVGSWGDIAAFSFYPTKNLSALGDGGIVVTSDASLSEKVDLLRQYGWRQRYVSEIIGINSRLDELQAAMLRIKLRYLDEENEKRRSLAAIYDEILSGTEIRIPTASAEITHVYHQYVLEADNRDHLRDFLREKGINTMIHYPVPIHLQPAYVRRLRCADPMHHTEKAAGRILSLPIYPELPLQHTTYVARKIISWLSAVQDKLKLPFWTDFSRSEGL